MPADSSPLSLLTAWSFEPQIVLGLVLLATIYVVGLRDLAQRGRLWRTVKRRHVAIFAAGWLVLVLALLSPLDSLDTRLFSVHMAQHLLLLQIAPLLLLLGKPVPVLLLGLPRVPLRRVTRWFRQTHWLERAVQQLLSPALAWPLYVGDLLLWHVPSLYNATLISPGVHLLEHLCFLFTATLFWWVVVQPWPGTVRLHPGVRLVFEVSAMLPMGMLGALFTFADRLWYPYYATHSPSWAMAPVDDQRLGGLIMWLPGSITYMAVAAVLFFVMLNADERSAASELGDQVAGGTMPL